MSLKIRRGTDAERLTITPAEGELIYTTDTKELYIGDGSTVGGNLVTSEGSGGGNGYTGSIGATGYTGSIGATGYTGSVPSGPAGYIGSFKGPLYSYNGTVVYDGSTTNKIRIDKIVGSSFTEVNIGTLTELNTLNVYGGPQRCVTLYGTVSGTYNIPVIEMRSSRGTMSSPTPIRASDMASALKSTAWNGQDYADIGGVIFTSTSLATSSTSSGKVSVYSVDTTGNPHFFDFNDNGDLSVDRGIRPAILTSAPTSPVTGTIYTANGVSWNPASKGGSKPYPVFYDGTSYNAFY
jgi:hypothetical protein